MTGILLMVWKDRDRLRELHSTHSAVQVGCAPAVLFPEATEEDEEVLILLLPLLSWLSRLL